MHRNTKIATCCYCGTRATLALRQDLHVLACARCGAPLRKLKNLPIERHAASSSGDSLARHGQVRQSPVRDSRKPLKKRGKSKGKFKAKHWLGEIFDEIEDIFD